MRPHSFIAYIQMLARKSLLLFCKLKTRLAERRNLGGFNSTTNANTNDRIQATRDLDSSIVIDGMPLDPQLEEDHFLVHGRPGSGKTQVITKILDNLRKRGDKVVISGYSSEYIQHYFREGIDKLLNPFDLRSETWDLWCEAKTKKEFDDIATSLISSHEEDSLLVVNAARVLFSRFAYLMRQDPNRSLKNLLTRLLSLRAKDLYAYLPDKGTDIFLPERIGTYPFFLRSIFDKYLGELAALRVQPSKSIFSIKKWISNTNDGSWLFLPFGEEHWQQLKHFSAMYFSIATSALLKLPENKERRIWFICDGLDNVNSIAQLPVKVRSASQHGGRFILSALTYNRLKSQYGEMESRELVDLIGTKLLLTLPDFDEANPLAVSPGTRVVRCAVSSASKYLPAKTRLPKLKCYFNLSTQALLSELDLVIEERNKIAEPFIANTLEPDPEVKNMCRQHHLYGMKADPLKPIINPCTT